MEVLGWDGALSSRDFHVAARAFANNWKEFNSAFPPWTWVPSPKQPPHLSGLQQQQQQHGYLSLEKICLLGSIKVRHVAYWFNSLVIDVIVIWSSTNHTSWINDLSQEDANEENHAWDEEEPESVDNATLVSTQLPVL